MRQCPYCSEEVQDNARKCKHCGEWLDGSKTQVHSDPLDKGSAAARAVSKGLKQKELHDETYGCLTFILLVISIVIGVATKSFWIGLLVFLVPLAFLTSKYYKE